MLSFDVTRREFILLLAGAAGHPLSGEIMIGDTRVQLFTEGRSGARLIYCNLHENERTSVAAARVVIGECGGCFFALRAQGHRLITFTLDGQRYMFDPNRMFSPRGIELTLQRYGRSSNRAREAVAALAGWFLEQTGVPRAAVVVALHNGALGGYSIRSYTGAGVLRHEAAAVYQNSRLEANDFFLVTESRFFDHLQARGLSVVLQARATMATDDGSFAFYCSRASIPYVNVEAAFGHLQRQIVMLREVHRMIDRECRGPA